MKILHVIPSVDPATGGPSEGVRQLCCLYRDCGLDVEVASLDDPKKVEEYDFPAMVHALGPSLGTYGFTLRAIPWLRKNIKRFDLVVLNSIWQYSTVAAYLALLGTAKPYAIFPHGMLDPYFKRRYPLKHLKKLVYWWLILRRIMNSAQAVFFTAEEERILARLSFPGYRVQESVVPYGSHGPDCDLENAREALYAQWPELRSKRLVITLGRIHPKKGTDILIEAFAQTMACGRDFHLLIAGPDQIGWKATLERQARGLGIEDRISWLGMIKGKTKWGALAASEVFVLTSHQENFGIVVAEALACNLPVILSNKINIWREIEQCSAGLIADDTVDGTVSSLARWMELSAPERAAFRQRSRACFDAYFNYRINAERLVKSVTNLSSQ